MRWIGAILGMAAAAAFVFVGAAWGQVSNVHGSVGGVDVGTGQVSQDAQEAQIRQRRYDQELAAARDALGKSQWYLARISLDNAQSLAATQAQSDALVPLWKQIEQEAQRQLQEALEPLKEGNYAKAIEDLTKVHSTFATVPSGQKALVARRQLESEPAVQAALGEAKAALLAQAIDRVAAGAASGPAGGPTRPASEPQSTSAPSRVSQVRRLPADQQSRVLEMLESLARAYPACPSGKQAAADLAELRADTELMARIERHRTGQEPAKLYNLAEAYRLAGQTAKAIELYKQLVQKYPQSPQSAKARAQIAALEPVN